MIYYKDNNNKLFAFEDNVNPKVISDVETKFNITLTKITSTEYASMIAPSFQDLKQQKLNKLKSDFINVTTKGVLLSTTINKKINVSYQSLINIDSLIDYMTNNKILNKQFRCYDNSFVTVTIAELTSIKQELINFGLKMYENKWNIENKITSATTATALNAINWDKNLNLI